MSSKAPEPEPRALTGEICFEEGDFHALSAACARDAQYNDRRLLLRRKLGTLAKAFIQSLGAGPPALDSRTSLHNPTSFNGMQVKRIWAYLCRSKKEKTRLRKVVGRDLAKDLDSAYRNAYLCVAVEEQALEVSLRIHGDAWFDGANLQKRVQAEGPRGLLERLDRLEGFRLQLADWKGEWVCGKMGIESLEELLGYYKPGELALSIEQRFPAPAGARGHALTPEAPAFLLSELRRLTELYRYVAWSEESDFLFS